MRSLKEIIQFARSSIWTDFKATDPIIPPSPDHVALTFATALLQSGKYADSPSSAIVQAWWLVPDFYHGRNLYAREIAPKLYFGMAEPTVEDPGEDMANTEHVNDPDFAYWVDLQAGA